MKVSDIKVPDGHVIVARSGSWRGLGEPMEEDESAHDIILGPDHFRVVPVARHSRRSRWQSQRRLILSFQTQQRMQTTLQTSTTHSVSLMPQYSV